MNRNRNIDYVSDVQLTTMAKNTTITESYGVRLSINQYEKDNIIFMWVLIYLEQKPGVCEFKFRCELLADRRLGGWKCHASRKI
jgi:hypothetical protein